ncbi:alpha/beta hydrolase [Kineosporia sp. NBRC 101731]|uniref:alpha/beta hydrolase n=1 Tax=Kineosporia sp. NBRC 101731 TaxID=3032199 RepID=UPI0024A37F9C|nr:alpha/beta hydrolase [Kineosporia sp. NBRC 101731]GLY31948.1 carboxylesterase [Kineosporia sp. NBRC 101731]
MPFLTNPTVARAITGLLSRGPGPRVPAEIAFAEIPATTESTRIPTRHGEIGATVYHPPTGVAGAPVYLNFHGGGFVIRHPEQDDALCRYLAAKAGVVVLNVDYDVAPRHPFPIPVEQGYDAAVWAADEGRPWDGTHLVVGGQSAGGAIAAAIARQALDQHGPDIQLQVLHYPPLDLATPGEQKRAAGKSIISIPMTHLFDTAYIPDPQARHHPLASPAWGGNAECIEGIAPALVVSCEYDRLHDESVRYAESLRAAGALVEHLDLLGVDHGYNLMGAPRELVERVYATIADRVRETTGP